MKTIIILTIIIFTIVIFAGAINGLQLEPVKFVNQKSGLIEIESNNLDLQSLTTAIKNRLIAKSVKLNDKFINSVSNEIYLALGATNTNVQRMTWKVNIASNVGTMDVFYIEATISEKSVVINFRTIQIIQPIPQLYNVVEKCERTGSRRYGIAGPRARECHYHNIPRSLNTDELILVTKTLESKVQEATKIMLQ
ncbi:hypothetical protein QJ850_gp166 [Acanthamoeba polyphaga mimivirus]|uniref:Uncharacterized protein n=1 Tax=Acanthamoeba polyphaga mimivirus Kroon TaxID=3069720 RepID=A0A0G2Y414_9VIRU|nr:hypothetical protein QJ850_gp166 [Acanthamoeba polyphaga mimivirus]AKI80533.1 hypothetical protein [Acanthamoeba polyphaga mimivirus Kroon]